MNYVTIGIIQAQSAEEPLGEIEVGTIGMFSFHQQTSPRVIAVGAFSFHKFNEARVNAIGAFAFVKAL